MTDDSNEEARKAAILMAAMLDVEGNVEGQRENLHNFRYDLPTSDALGKLGEVMKLAVADVVVKGAARPLLEQIARYEEIVETGRTMSTPQIRPPRQPVAAPELERQIAQRPDPEPEVEVDVEVESDSGWEPDPDATQTISPAYFADTEDIDTVHADLAAETHRTQPADLSKLNWPTDPEIRG